MQVIGRKRNHRLFGMILGLIAGLVIAVCTFFLRNESIFYIIVTFVFALFIILFSIGSMVIYCTTVDEPIILLNEDEILINKKMKIRICDIVDVSYRRAYTYLFRYFYGTVIIKTKRYEHDIRYVADCEDVAKKLTALMYASKEAKQNEQATKNEDLH